MNQNESSGKGLIGVSHKEAVEVFKGTPDGAARDFVLNTGLVKLVDGVVATASTVDVLRSLVAEQEETGEAGYMPQAIGALTDENLMGIANALVIEVENPEVELRNKVAEAAGLGSLQSALADIKQTATGEGDTTVEKGSSGEPKEVDPFESQVMQELAERLVNDKTDPTDLITAVDAGMTPQLFDLIVKSHPEVLAGLMRHAGSLTNEKLRNILIRRAVQDR